MKQQPSVFTLKAKLRLERQRVRQLEDELNRVQWESKIHQEAVWRASNIIMRLDKDGKFFDEVFKGNITESEPVKQT
jgi:hypothetical protein